MMSMGEALDDLLHNLDRSGSLKVWSLIITFFGDAIVPRGGRVSAQTVRRLMTRLGIEAGAVRTAFSRLAADGWVDRERHGRLSYYGLSKRGLSPFRQAAARIYAPPMDFEPSSRSWLLAVFPPSARIDAGGVKERGGVCVSRECVIFADRDESLKRELRIEGCLLVEGQLDDVPSWVKEAIADPVIARGYERLMELFSPLALYAHQDPLEAMAARCLLIHEWRRLLFRSPSVPTTLLPEEWPAHRCRVFVASLYIALLPSAEAWLDSEAFDLKGPLPAPDPPPTNRFAGGSFM